MLETNLVFYGSSFDTVMASTAVPLGTNLYFKKLTKLSSTIANDTKQSDLRQLTAPRAWDCTNWNLLRNADIFHDWHHTSEKVEKGLKVLNTLRKVPWLSISSSSIIGWTDVSQLNPRITCYFTYLGRGILKGRFAYAFFSDEVVLPIAAKFS